MRIKWLGAAHLDFDEIEAYNIAEDRSAVVVDVVVKIIKAVSLLGEQQGIGRAGRVPGTKELIVPGLPYIVPIVSRTKWFRSCGFIIHRGNDLSAYSALMSA